MTTKAKRTPGPWTFTTPYAWKAEVVGRNNAKIASVFIPRQNGVQDFTNARLVAAAPELVEALRDMTAACDRVLARLVGSRPLPNDVSWAKDILARNQDRARAVLAQLEGGKS